jgi:hypothetical protein
LIELDLTAWEKYLRLKREAGVRYLLDPVRNKWLVVQPEEIVRQLMVQYLIREKKYNRNRIRIEQGLSVNGLSKRCDILIYNKAVEPLLLVECKSPKVPIKQAVFEQIANYNLPLQVKYLVVTNGPATFCCEMDYKTHSFNFLSAIPEYPVINVV